MKYPTWVSILLILFSCSIFVDCESIDDDIAIIHQRMLEMVLWPPKYNISNTIQSAISYNEQLNSSCYWEDIDYNNSTLSIWFTFAHLLRVNVMVQVLTVPGSTVLNDPKLANGTHCGKYKVELLVDPVLFLLH